MRLIAGLSRPAAAGAPDEVILRTWQPADKMKKQSGALDDDKGDNDNLCARRYVARYTINRR